MLGASNPSLRELFDELSLVDSSQWERRISELKSQDTTTLAALRKLLSAHAAMKTSFLKPVAMKPASFAFVQDSTVVGAREGGGGFRVHQSLGKGASGEVFLATQLELGRLVALKMYHYASTEPRLLAKLKHHHIVSVYGVTPISEANTFATFMQLIPGVDLHKLWQHFAATGTLSGSAILQFIDEQSQSAINEGDSDAYARAHFAAQPPVQILIEITLQMCLALEHAHGHNVLHLDVKPSNILIDHNGKAWLTDFSISISHQQPGVTGGTPEFMAPEQLRAFTQSDTELDARADIYALGKTVQHALSSGAFVVNPAEPLLRELRALLSKCTQEDPAQRFSNCTELALHIRAIQKAQALRQRLAAICGGRLWDLVRRWPVIATLLCVILPNVVSSILQIIYNDIYILSLTSPEQRRIFGLLLVPINLFNYSIGMFLFWRVNRTVIAALAQRNLAAITAEQCVKIRAEIARVPWVSCVVMTLLWALGFFQFTFILHVFGGGLSAVAWMHFILSFTIAAVTLVGYSFVLLACIHMLVIYPQWLLGARNPIGGFVEDAKILRRLMGIARFVTGAVPCLAAILILLLDNPVPTHGFIDRDFLAVLFIAAGIMGFAIAMRGSDVFMKGVNVVGNI